MNTLFLYIISGFVFSLLFYCIRLHRRSKRFQQYADLSIQVMQIEDQRKSAAMEGSFVFQLKVKNKDVRHVVFEDISFSEPSLKINNFNKLLLEVPVFDKELPLRSIGFSCNQRVLKTISESKNSLTIRGFVVLSKQQRRAFSYNTKISSSDNVQKNTVKGMQVA